MAATKNKEAGRNISMTEIKQKEMENEAFNKGNDIMLLNPAQGGAVQQTISILFQSGGVFRLRSVFAAILFLGLALSTAAQSVVFRPQDHGRVISNPGMGWNFCYFSNNLINFGTTLKEGDTLNWWPGADIVFFRLGWSHLEPEEGEFNWEITDRVAEQWRAAGKRAAFSWVVCYPGFQDTPLWVRDAGAKGVLYDVSQEAAAKGMTWHPNPKLTDYAVPQTWVPHYDDPVFLEKFGNFLAAAAERYDGQPWVEFIQVGSLGSWGEGHQHLSWPAVITPAMQRIHLKLWKRHFPNTQLFINDGWGGNEILNLARNMDYGIGDHSVQVPGEKFRNYAADPVKAARFWPDVPVEIEHHPDTIPGPLYEQAAQNWRASYLRIHVNPYRAWKLEKERIQRMGLRTGYRFQIQELEFPVSARRGSAVPVNISLKNAGHAPCYKGGHIHLHLRGIETQNEIRHSDTGFNVRDLHPGVTAESASPEERQIAFPVPQGLAPGQYELLISIGPEDGVPFYQLPYNEAEDGCRLPAGQVRIE
jgi:hypothetical protein